MAYALGFTRSITDLIYSMRDWRLEQVRRNGGTSSRLALHPFEITTQRTDQVCMDTFNIVSFIDVKWRGNYADDDGITPYSGEDDEHWIQDSNGYYRWRNWNYGPQMAIFRIIP